MPTWKEKLASRMDPQIAEEIDVFESQMALRRANKMDEKVFAERLTRGRPIQPSLEAMRWARETCLQLLDRMTEDDWKKVGTHSESGPYSTEDWLRIYAAHGHDHAAQITRARGR